MIERDVKPATGKARATARTPWLVVVVLLVATAVFVPARIYYKQHQTPAVKPGLVVIQNFAFAPDTFTVSAGTKVTFTNSDGGQRAFGRIA